MADTGVAGAWLGFLADGRAVALSRVNTFDAEFRRFDTSGALDGSFGNAGLVTVPGRFGAAPSLFHTTFAEVTPSGWLQHQIVLPTPFDTLSGPCLALDPDGESVACGVFPELEQADGKVLSLRGCRNPADRCGISVTRWLPAPSGVIDQLDTSFGSDGTLAPPGYVNFGSLASDAAGRLLVGGGRQVGNLHSVIVLTRRLL